MYSSISKYNKKIYKYFFSFYKLTYKIKIYINK